MGGALQVEKAGAGIRIRIRNEKTSRGRAVLRLLSREVFSHVRRCWSQTADTVFDMARFAGNGLLLHDRKL